MKSIKAKIGANGCAYGKAYVLNSDINITKQNITDIDLEEKKIEEAVNAVKLILEDTKETADEQSGTIVDAQIAMLYDEVFLGRICRMIADEGVCAEYAVCEVGKICAEEFERIDNSYINARGADIRGIVELICRQLLDKTNVINIDSPAIVCARELTPGLVSTIDKTNVKAFVSTGGTKTSHVSILCGNYGIPYLFGVDFAEADVKNGIEVAIDSKTGTFFVEPTDEVKRQIDECVGQVKIVEDMKLDTGSIQVCANIGSDNEAKNALESGADGIGLFRTEFLYMGEKLPTEEEQFEVYKSVAVKMVDKPVVIRTLDIGADKKSPCVKLRPEDNPALGKRAIRICLEDRNLFKTQLRAILRAAVYGNVKIMYPMISSVAEVDEIEAIIREVENELNTENIDYAIPDKGVMIETPSAALLSDKLASKVDFFSIGTNDLTQYTLAVDRMAEELDDYFDTHSEAVMRLVKLVVQNAHAAGIWVGICGELGGDEWAIPQFVEIGVDELSVSPSKIGMTKAIAKETFAKLNSREKIKQGMEIMCAPADGELVEMSMIPDTAFSTGIMGKCMGIIPRNGNIYSPCDGKVYMVAETKHAIGITSDYGNDVLVHVGIDTVTLGGRGFEVFVSEGECVTKGMLIMKVDLEVIRNADLSDMVITVGLEDGRGG